MTEEQQEKSVTVPADYYASVWIETAALRRTPDIYAPIDSKVHRGELLHITAERDDLCQLDDGLWVLGAALEYETKTAGRRTGRFTKEDGA